MANDVLPMRALFPVCRDVLQARLQPLHYAELTRLALRHLGIPETAVNWARQIEDVREKLLLAGRYASFYVGRPHCLGAARGWFATPQYELVNPTHGIRIPARVQPAITGAFETALRWPHMQAHFPALPTAHARAAAQGLVLEHYVRAWFQEHWPEFYRAPDNAGRWTQACAHDFKLVVHERVYAIDVCGPGRNGVYRLGNKLPVHFHLLCAPLDTDVLWFSVRPGRIYTAAGELELPAGGIAPERMIVWLNCMQAGLPYTVLKTAAGRGNA